MSTESKYFERESIKLDFAQINGMILKDLNETNSGQNFLKSYKSTDVARYLANPPRYAKELGGMSTALYYASPHYRRLINYYANMATLDYIVEPYGIDHSKNINIKSLKNGYQKANDLADLMNIKHEFKKVMKSAWIRDTYYGYEFMSKDSYFIKELPFEYCQISSIEDGVYNIGFNFQYFDRNPSKLDFYPKEFKNMYNKFKNGTQGQWQELDTSKTIVLKINEDITNDMPPFTGLFKSIYDIEDYKALKMASETMKNYKFVVQKIPIRDNSERNNDFLIDLANVAMFHNKTSATLPDSIGLITTPFEVDTINFAKDKSESDNVEEAERQFYTGAGTSSQLFNGSKNSNANLGKSVTVDESEVFTVLRQIERFVNRKMKREIKGTFKFRIKILDTTYDNRSKYSEQLLKSAQYGVPVRLMLGASLGLTSSEMDNMAFLENEILNLPEKLIPLSSSHTQSGENVKDATDEGGRPELGDDELTEKGEEQRDRGDNDNKE